MAKRIIKGMGQRVVMTAADQNPTEEQDADINETDAQECEIRRARRQENHRPEVLAR